MARGPIKHLKRLNAPKHWMLDKLGGVWAPRPSTGPHKLRECLPLSLILRNRLRYSLTRRETVMIVLRRLVRVDHQIRTDLNYPAGFQDVITLPKTDETFRVLLDTKGRFVLHRITKEEGAYKLLRVNKISTGSKVAAGRNPFHEGQAGAVPIVVAHDGRTVRFVDPHVKANDTIRFDIKTGRPTGYLKFDVGSLAIVTKGANIGRVGVISAIDRHPGSFDIVHLKDRKGNTFATRIGYVFVIGDNNKPWISLPKGKGVKLNVFEEREQQLKKE